MWNSFPILLVKLAIPNIPLTLNVTYLQFLAYSNVLWIQGRQGFNMFSQLDMAIDLENNIKLDWEK